jgi:hypothetical protein
LADYAAAHAKKTQRPDLIALAIDRLSKFFDIRPANSINPELCGKYVEWRTAQRDARAKKSMGRPIAKATARRELGVLGAALKWGWENTRIDRLVPVKKPEDALPRERHLTRSEAAALLAAALGWDKNGKRHRDQINRHLARFIVLGIYTGTARCSTCNGYETPLAAGSTLRPTSSIDAPWRWRKAGNGGLRCQLPLNSNLTWYDGESTARDG